MIYELMKRDPAWKHVQALTAASAVLFLAWGVAGPAVDATTADSIFRPAFIFVLVFSVGAATMRVDEGRLQAALPISARQIFMARALSIVGGIWIPVLDAIAVIISFREFINSNPVMILTRLASVSMLAMLAIESTGARSAKMWRWVLVFACSSALWDAARAWQVPVVMVCWILSAAVFIRIWFAPPDPFAAAPRKAAPSVDARIGYPEARGATGQIPWRALLRVATVPLMYFVAFLEEGMSPSVFACIFVLFAWMLVRQSTRWLLALPIAPWTLLSLALGPLLIAPVAGYEVNLRLPWSPRPSGIDIRLTSSQSPLVRRADRGMCKMLNVSPPLDYWLRTTGGGPAPIRAPWGETFQPSSWSVAGFDAFNPYAVGCGSSQRFFDWQLSRATAAVYGKAMSRADFRELPWLTPLRVRTRIEVVTGSVLVIAVLFIVFLMQLGDWYRFRRLPRSVQLALQGLPAAIGLVIAILDLFGNMKVFQRVSWILPEDLIVTIVLLLLPIVALYWGIDKMFRESEVVSKVATPSV